MNDCLFCKIINKEIPKEFRFESDVVVAFDDINPSADVHILIMPKRHISGMGEIGEGEGKLLTQVFEVVKKLVRDNNL